ncbi:hypothetical protein [Anaerosolibacter sp.]|uniref:hypothetical protein n=1 Tax=Anaerosolibacter sp. TaxID=1872527 RepID=UPI0039EFE4F8
MSIYNDPQKYSETCKCSLEIARKRCDYYRELEEKGVLVKCPECGASHDKLTFDDDGSEYSTETFISCTTCWVGFNTDDERLNDWVEWQWSFDEVLYFAANNQFDEVNNWESFVKESTDELD